MHGATNLSVKCFMSREVETWLWNKRLAHINMKNIKGLPRKELVHELSKLKLKKKKLCDACQKYKKTKASHKDKNAMNKSTGLELLYIDLFDCSRYTSLNSSRYYFVIIDNYTKYT